jgi:hypothetical protein
VTSLRITRSPRLFETVARKVALKEGDWHGRLNQRRGLPSFLTGNDLLAARKLAGAIVPITYIAWSLWLILSGLVLVVG